jgi:hypothetical protein
MEEQSIYEDDVDALKATVLKLGGYQKVGLKLWPDKSAQYAGRNLADCCNPNRSERLRPSQLLLVMRWAREIDCHILAEHFMAETGYSQPEPLDFDKEAAVVLDRIDEALGTAAALATRLERLRGMSPHVRVVAK